ncbi:MAG: phosphoenolpyruvate synthase [Anaerolineales bacterium]|nr:phosphoenolpyruvate synthase [Anaerolineales bacterium]
MKKPAFLVKSEYVLPFSAISAADLPRVGGKGANLGEMTQAGLPVPPGFCVTTAAFRAFMTHDPGVADIYDQLATLTADDLERVRQVGATVRERLTAVSIPQPIAQAVMAAWQAAGTSHAYAIRSSATAEDLPTASFAGQQDTYLNIIGQEALLEHVRRCWVSLFTDRAILYRIQNGFDHHDVALSVVVQQMVLPTVSGILFTADPVSGHRHIATIDASYGLGEALVSGIVSADLYKVDKRSLAVVGTTIADKQVAIRPLPGGGTQQEAVGEADRTRRVLDDGQLRQLTDLGNRVESHYQQPQDIEWAIADDTLYLLQTRPITSLYPLPQPRPTDDSLHLYVSFNHAQVMTDPISPMGQAVWRLLLPFGKAAGQEQQYNPYMPSAGGRLYIDASPLLRHPVMGRQFSKMLQIADPLISQGIQAVLSRPEVQAEGNRDNRARTRTLLRLMLPVMARAQRYLWWGVPETAVSDITHNTRQQLDDLQRALDAAAPGADRLRVVQQLISTVFLPLVLTLPPYLIAGMVAKGLLGRVVGRRANPADLDALQRGLVGNVTTEMDLAVGDLADLLRKLPASHPFRSGETDELPAEPTFQAAWQVFLQKYGMRGPGEIDIARPRWQDDPRSLLQVIRANGQHEVAGQHRRHFQKLIAEAEQAGERLVAAAQHGLLGGMKAKLARRLVRAMRGYLAMREHPKYFLVQFLDMVRVVLEETAVFLHQQNRLDTLDDIWYLDLLELIAALEQPNTDLRPRIQQRRADYRRFDHLTPPRVVTSDGEIPTVQFANSQMPAGALAGNPVSTGVVEGIAHVVRDPAQEMLAPGEILVAPFTDPGWTPLFINAAGLVMEVGGLMTHGSVVAREYGIPAVVGVPEATRRIQTGQRVRVHGDGGYVEILDK